jgi:cysteine desulfurase
VQGAGRLPLSIAELDADFLILSSHKLGGPKGAGALVARGEVLMPKPLIHGGGQEKGHRSGTENVSAIAGFAAAARAAIEGMDGRNIGIAGLRDRMEAGMAEIAADVVIHGRLPGRDVSRLCNTTFFSLPGLKSETGQIAFDLEGIALSAGSACSSGKVKASHVLAAMGLGPLAEGSLRASGGWATTEDDWRRFAEAWTAAYARYGARHARAREFA